MREHTVTVSTELQQTPYKADKCTHPGPRLALPRPHGPNSAALGYGHTPKVFVCVPCYKTYIGSVLPA